MLFDIVQLALFSLTKYVLQTGQSNLAKMDSCKNSQNPERPSASAVNYFIEEGRKKKGGDLGPNDLNDKSNFSSMQLHLSGRFCWAQIANCLLNWYEN